MCAVGQPLLGLSQAMAPGLRCRKELSHDPRTWHQTASHTPGRLAIHSGARGRLGPGPGAASGPVARPALSACLGQSVSLGQLSAAKAPGIPRRVPRHAGAKADDPPRFPGPRAGPERGRRRRRSPSVFDRFIEHVYDAVRTLQEFGAPGEDVQTFLHGPLVDPQGRRHMQEQALRRTLRHLMRYSPYYQKRFASLPFAPNALTVDTLSQFPLTDKSALVTHKDDFITTNSHPSLSTRTTGTTGKPVEIWLSRDELALWSALGVLGQLLGGQVAPDGVCQINISLRATAVVEMTIIMCQLIGTRVLALGILPVEMSLDSLLEGGSLAPTVLTTYPSYLAELVIAARRRGLGPADFRLGAINVVSEVLSSTLAHAAQETFGASIREVYAMTEILPVGGGVCSQGHLHMDVSTSFPEVIGLETDAPAAPGDYGILV